MIEASEYIKVRPYVNELKKLAGTCSKTNEYIIKEIQQGVNVKENSMLLFAKNVPLILKIISKFSSKESIEDLLQVAYIGLLDAMPGYDETQGKFTTYFPFYVRNAIRKHLAYCGRTIRIPLCEQALYYQYERLKRYYENVYGVEPSIKDYAIHLNISERKVTSIKKVLEQQTNIISLDKALDDNIDILDTIKDSTNIENQVMEKVDRDIMKKDLYDLMNRVLPSNQRDVIIMHYIESKTLREIGAIKGVSGQNVRDLERRGLKTLRRSRGSRNLALYMGVSGTKMVLRNQIY